jgi:hypothetical protein
LRISSSITFDGGNLALDAPEVFGDGLKRSENANGKAGSATTRLEQIPIEFRLLVMAGHVPAIHVLLCAKQDVDARIRGHDVVIQGELNLL